MHRHYNRLFIWSISVAISKNLMLLDWQPDGYSISAPVWLHQDTGIHSSQTDWQILRMKFYIPIYLLQIPSSIICRICIRALTKVKYQYGNGNLLYPYGRSEVRHVSACAITQDISSSSIALTYWHKNSSSLLIWVQFSWLVVIWFM